MRLVLGFALGFWAVSPGLAGEGAPPFKVPAGFELERVAGPPLVERPIMACFDDQGRLYVSDSAGVNLRGSELLKDPPHRIRILEDTDGDGTFDTSRVWADKLVFPQGLLWHDGAVYTTSPPCFWKLEDTDGDGVCDKRTPLITGLANTGVADDAHGACLGPDGLIYFLPGRMKHDMKTRDGKPLRKGVGPWLVRMKPDGSDAEIVCGSPGNPVEVDWTPEGDYFISGTFWAPSSFGGGLRDALVHGVEGGEYPVRDRTYTDRIRTGSLLPVLVRMVATAPSGMMIYRSGAFGKDWSGNLLCSYFNPHKVQRHVLERDGATWRARTEEFITSSNSDFHPTDVLEDADGSLLVVDTGGWFRIGCPTSKIAKPQVLGGIYRIRRKEMPKVEDPRGLKVDWAKADYPLLEDPRFVVRWKAMREIARRVGTGEKLEPRREATRKARLHSVWTLARTGELGTVRERYLNDKDAGVRQAAAAVAGLHRDRKSVDRLMELVRKDAPPVRREAATALGRIGASKAIPALLDALRDKPDRFLEHALVFALIRIGERKPVVKALADPRPDVRRGALVALDQMKNGRLTPDLVTPLLDPVDLALQQAALAVITKRSAWAGEVFGIMKRWLAEPVDDPGRRANIRGVVTAFCRDEAMQDLVARALRNPETPAETRLVFLEAIAGAPLDEFPATWVAEARWCLDHSDTRVVRQAVSTLRATGTKDFDGTLLLIAGDGNRPVDLRVEAAAVAAGRRNWIDPKLVDFLIGRLDGENPPFLRLRAAEALGRAPLQDRELTKLAGAIRTGGALEVPRLIRAFGRSRNSNVGQRLVKALKNSPGLESVSPEVLREALRRYRKDVHEAAKPLFTRLALDTEKQKAKLAELKPAASGGDAARGRRVFFGKKAGCTACHMVQGQGGRVGPDLTKIGSIRSGDDLLEAIVFPSATFARTYEPFLIRTKDGGVHDGLISRETADAVYLFTAQREERRIPRVTIDAIRESKVSVMPQGLDNQLSRRALQDLIAYLRSLK